MDVIRLVAGLFAALLGALAAACGEGDSGDATPTIPPLLQTARAGGGQLPPARGFPPGLAPVDLQLLLREDLAARLGIAVTDTSMKAFCSVTWPDGSIGVAKPGSAYTQALVPGFLGIVTANGKEYRYHGAESGYIAADFEPGARVNRDLRCP